MATESDLDFDIHDRCRKARLAAHLTQSQLAERIGVSTRTVSRYESRASTHLHPIFLEQWAIECGVPAGFLQEEGSKKRGNRTHTTHPKNIRRAA